MKPKIAIHWFRRDLRTHDNTALWHAVSGDLPVLPLFIYDKNILDKLPDEYDQRVWYIFHLLVWMRRKFFENNTNILIKYGTPMDVWKEVLEEYDVGAVYFNRDYEPYAQQRDRQIYELLTSKGIPFKGYKDHVIFEKDEVLSGAGKPYTVFTPYSKTWKALYAKNPPTIYGNAFELNNFIPFSPFILPSMEMMGFKSKSYHFTETVFTDKAMQQYEIFRDFPFVKGTSRLGMNFRFGSVSIREMAQRGDALSTKWLNELIWRDFYQMILYHFPHVVNRSFKPQYDAIEWRNDEKEFELWCNGMTGYPMVDAGMRELNATGFMHNRVRMITASFLTKHLLIDWRWGETYFAQKLIDYELASNNGGWQWAAGCGCDAAPYFRIFNPMTQAKAYDPDMNYIKMWIPDVLKPTYPKPIVEHNFARLRALATYKAALDLFKEGG